SSFTQQKQLAQAKLMERTPAFTTIQNSTVPIKHAGPKRMIFVLCVLFITFLVRTILLIRKDDTITF
ncbi:MAG: chain-length determining protein, partial [Bacteroidaceae bacterium]|nr:chain-length determining protein [Bacteroidaceae bacterium]